MNTYLIAVPIKAGKTEAWKSYMKEITGPRFEEYKAARKKAGIKKEKAYLQHTPQGDMAIVMLGGDNPRKALESFLTSNEPFDKWFRETVLTEIHGMDPSQSIPANEQYIDYHEVPAGEVVGAGKAG